MTADDVQIVDSRRSQTAATVNLFMCLFVALLFLTSENFWHRECQDSLIAHIRDDHFLVFRIQHDAERFLELRPETIRDFPSRRYIAVIVIGPYADKSLRRFHFVDDSRHSHDNQLPLWIDLHLVDPDDARL